MFLAGVNFNETVSKFAAVSLAMFAIGMGGQVGADALAIPTHLVVPTVTRGGGQTVWWL